MISFELFLNTIKFTVYLLLVLYSAYTAYYHLTTKEQRKTYRTKLQKEIVNRKEQMITRADESTLAEMIRKAGYPFFLTAFRFQILRWTLIIILMVYYFIIPSLSNGEIKLINFGYVAAILIFTSPGSKISITRMLFNQVMAYREKKKREELFTLYDMIKAELKTLNDDQEVNVHNLLKGLINYFEYINLGIMKFMRMWKSSPQQARISFSEEVGGEHAEVLANILYRLDLSTKGQALELINSSSEVFSSSFFEKESRKGTKKVTIIDLFLFGGNLLSLVWVLVMVISMFGNFSNFTNQ